MLNLAVKDSDCAGTARNNPYLRGLRALRFAGLHRRDDRVTHCIRTGANNEWTWRVIHHGLPRLQGTPASDRLLE